MSENPEIEKFYMVFFDWPSFTPFMIMWKSEVLNSWIETTRFIFASTHWYVPWQWSTKLPVLIFSPGCRRFSPQITLGFAKECLQSSHRAPFYSNQKLSSTLYLALTDILQSDTVDAFFLQLDNPNDQKHRSSPQIPGGVAGECLPSSRRAIKSCSQHYI